MKAITSPASSMISSTLLPWLNSRRIEDVRKRMSIPSAHVWTATRASSMWQRTWVSTFALKGNAAIVRQSSNDWGDATGEVSSMYSTPNASSIFAMAILSAVVKCAFENCSPSRSVESMIAKRSIATVPPSFRRMRFALRGPLPPSLRTSSDAALAASYAARGHRGLSNKKPGAQTCHRASREEPGHTAALRGGVSPIATVRLLPESGPARDPETDLWLRRSHRSHRIWRKLVPPRHYCLRPHLWPATLMKLLLRSLGRGFEGCKAVFPFARLAGAARCGDRHPDSGRPTVHTRHGPDHSVDTGLDHPRGRHPRPDGRPRPPRPAACGAAGREFRR